MRCVHKAVVALFVALSSQANSALASDIIDEFIKQGNAFALDCQTYHKCAFSANKGDPLAQHRMGDFHLLGEEAILNVTAALNWYSKSAELGHPTAQFNLGYLLKRGIFVRQDVVRSISYLKRAAAQGYPHAHFELGKMFLEGDGVRKDLIEANKHFIIAGWMAERYRDSATSKRSSTMVRQDSGAT